ncbi:MAG: hypothetical protein QGG36_02715 [Pirellulaceae bacterium]|nr:hypothetical protein [Pirellulaceae bacterium]
MGCALIPTSLLLWWVSYKFFRFCFYVALATITESADVISLWMSIFALAVLAFEGSRYREKLFNVNNYLESDMFDNFLMESQSARTASYYFGHPTVVAYWLSQFFYAAPRTAVLSIHYLRSRLPTDEEAFVNAARILRELKESHEWSPAIQYRRHVDAVLILDALHLIWTKEEHGQVVLRYPAGEA